MFNKRKKTFVILDNLRNYYNKRLKKCVKTKKEKFEVCSLSLYSSELNPDESLNRYLKNNSNKRIV